MSNPIKYNTLTESLALKKGNFWIGTGDVGKGTTASTGYYDGITPPTGGYTIYLNKATGGPQIHTAANDTQLITLTNIIAGANYTTANECFNYFATQSDRMVVNREYESVVTNGLVLCLDAGFTASYPRNGATWYDNSVNSSDASLINGPTYSSADGGAITFDGINDYSDFYAPNISTIATVEMWCKITSGFDGKMFFGWLYYDIYCAFASIGYNTGNGDVYGINSATVSSLGCVNNWKQYIFEMRSDVSYTNNKIYVNASQQSLSQINSSEYAPNRNLNSGYGRIAVWRGSGGYEMPMNCAIFRVYNRILTQAEITQNFNAQKSRFGIV